MAYYPLVSVIIPTYKKFEFLPECVDSVLKQKYPNIEIIVTDDGSNNYDEKFIKSLFMKVNSNIKNIQVIHHESNIGSVKNVNNAFKLSSGQIIKILDMDDYLYDEMVLMDVVKEFERTGAEVIVGKVKRFHYHMEKGEKVFVSEKPIDSLLPELLKIKPMELFKALCIDSFIPSPGVFFKREIFERFSLFDENYYFIGDHPYFLKLSRNNVAFHFFDRYIAYYRLGSLVSAENPKTDVGLKDLIRIREVEIGPFLEYKSKLAKYNSLIEKYLKKGEYILNKKKFLLLLFIHFPKIPFSLLYKLLKKQRKLSILEILIEEIAEVKIY